jgi:hypothetical protein
LWSPRWFVNGRAPAWWPEPLSVQRVAAFVAEPSGPGGADGLARYEGPRPNMPSLQANVWMSRSDKRAMDMNSILILLVLIVAVTLYIMRRRVRLGRRTPKF